MTISIDRRQIATLDEIRSIELHCPKRGCGGILAIDLRPGCIDDEEQCPRCKRTWWTPKEPSTALELLRALTSARNRHHSEPDAPIIQLILPEPAGAIE